MFDYGIQGVLDDEMSPLESRQGRLKNMVELLTDSFLDSSMQNMYMYMYMNIHLFYQHFFFFLISLCIINDFCSGFNEK